MEKHKKRVVIALGGNALGKNLEEQEQNEERDTMQKTLTQNIGEDVMQIPEPPIHVYYQPENFCDYDPL